MLAKRCLRWKGELTTSPHGAALCFAATFCVGIGFDHKAFSRKNQDFAAKN
jgi:hypothetical protein